MRNQRSRARLCAAPAYQPEQLFKRKPMGSTPSGSAKPIIGAALPPHHEIDRDGGSRASAGGRI